MSFQAVGVFDRERDLVMLKTLHFWGWNAIPHFGSHSARELRSSWSIKQSSGLLICRYTMQSSAKSLVLETILSGRSLINNKNHTGQCKRTGGCYNELVVAFLRTGDGLTGKKIYTCWLYELFISLHLFYFWWHLAHRPTVTLQFMTLPSSWWFNSWFGLQIQHSSGVLPWQVHFSSISA